MPPLPPARLPIAIGVAMLGIAGALALGASLAAVLVVAAAGACAIALAWPRTAPAASGSISDPIAALPVEPSAAAISIEAIDDPLLLVDRRRVTAANAAARMLLGEYIVDEDIRIAIRHPAASDVLTGPADDARPASVALAGLGDPGQRWELMVRPLRDGRRLVRLTDRSQAHAAERMRVDFVANASHELRTPLAAILGFAETLEEANGPADTAVRLRFIALMTREAKRMQRLIEDLISLSRIEADRHRAPGAAVALEPLVREIADTQASARTPPPEIVISAARDIGDVAGDRVQLSQLLHNLIDNALKYGAAGRPVTIGLAAAGANVRLTVTDQGDGIAPEHLPRLTERFYRVDGGRSRAMGGTGLGLAIVKHIVERHRGRLAIESTAGTGTRVSIDLPLAPTALASGDAEL